MKIYIPLLFILAYSGNKAFAQNKARTDQVQKVVVSFFNALAKGATTEMTSFCTIDFLLLENGEQWNIDTLVQKIGSPKPKDFRRTNEFFFFNSRVSNKHATLHYLNTAMITSNGRKLKIQWLESVGLVKNHGVWKLLWMHSTLKSKTEIL